MLINFGDRPKPEKPRTVCQEYDPQPFDPEIKTRPFGVFHKDLTPLDQDFSPVWITKQGDRVRLVEMSVGHLINLKKTFERLIEDNTLNKLDVWENWIEWINYEFSRRW